MIRISQIKLRVNHTPEDLKKAIFRELRIPDEELISYKIAKRSIDARKKPELKFIYTIEAKVKNEEEFLKKCKSIQVAKAKDLTYQIPENGETPLQNRPVIAGTGPAGLFCGLLLAKAGLNPILLERGEDVDARTKSVEQFWIDQKLNKASNVQFGEGGAGTFSDGKLNTMVKDELGRNRYVLESLVQSGADSEILYHNKPHIGTDVLRTVVKNLRQEILSLGGEVRFLSQVTDLISENGRITEVVINEKEHLKTDVFVLAIGHSARDTFEMLAKKPVDMIAKAFALGIRIEHPQIMINESQYGIKDPGHLMAADYKLTKKLANQRGVYSFCMCPGGYVVDASSEEGRIAVNGMSYQKRDSANANSAIVVTVTPDDYQGTGPLSGVEFQRNLESAAFKLCNGKVPVQLFEDYQANRVSSSFGEFEPCIKGSYGFGNLKEILPEFLSTSIEQGILEFDHMIHGFSRKDAILTGIESRTSSPVRITRDEEFESNMRGLYPCGEGAGYAGGITSAAMDGMKTAEAIIKKYRSI